jgi:hypothetical protein
MVDEWLGDLRSLRDLKRSTIRSYSEAVRAFCHFATDPAYEWSATCEQRFGCRASYRQFPRLLLPILGSSHACAIDMASRVSMRR